MSNRLSNFLNIAVLAGMSVILTSPAHGNLLHQYIFAGDIADQVGAADGTIVGAPGSTASAGVLTLNGGSWVTFGSNFLVPTSGSYSVLLFAQFTYDGNTHEFISQGNSGAPGFYIGPYGNEMRVGDNYGWTATPVLNGGCCTSIATPTDGEWHHYALVVNSGNAEFFIDGISRGTRAGFSIGGASPTVLGSQFGGNSELFTGSMKDVRIYDNALTGSDVAAVIAADAAAPEPASATLLGGALLGAAWLARRRAAVR